MAKKEKKRKKKNIKNAILRSVIALFIVCGLLIFMSCYFFGIYRESYYPKEVVDDTQIEVMARKAVSGTYTELYDIAMALADNGNGVMITPIGTRNYFDYNGETLAKLSTSSGEGRITIAKGTGNVVEDMKTHSKDYFNFIGSVTPSYDEKVSESGIINGYQAAYTCGRLSCGNFLDNEKFYIVALEYATTDSDRLLLVYSTTKFKELGRNLKVLEDIADLALQGAMKNTESPDTEESKDKPVSEKTEDEITSEDIGAINDYLEEKYGTENASDIQNQTDTTVEPDKLPQGKPMPDLELTEPDNADATAGGDTETSKDTAQGEDSALDGNNETGNETIEADSPEEEIPILYQQEGNEQP